MNLSEFDYQIPERQIAQYPLKERDASRLLVLHRKSGTMEHRRFTDIISYLKKGDVLILNNTRVIPVRLRGTKPSGGKAEVTLIQEREKNVWTVLARYIREGEIQLAHGISAQISRTNGTLATAVFQVPDSYDPDIRTHLEEIGVMPLPVYIKRDAVDTDSRQYQTVYAAREGAIAAPTAGLHFTENLLQNIQHQGIEIHFITLHVGYGTFQPVEKVDIRDHEMATESFDIPETTAEAVNRARKDGRRVMAVGTTVTRALEGATAVNGDGMIHPGPGETALFIYPGFRFMAIDALLTNFHLPKSTPMMLASAFSSLPLLKRVYAAAQAAGYRFYSYGDAMLIL